MLSVTESASILGQKDQAHGSLLCQDQTINGLSALLRRSAGTCWTLDLQERHTSSLFSFCCTPKAAENLISD